MLHRRHFIVGASAAVAAPFIIKGVKAATPRVRRDVMGLPDNDPFFAKYAAAVKRMHELPSSDRRSWRNQSLIHMNHCTHNGDEFFPWHRHYLANFEAICGELIGDPDFALPYWNWSAKNGKLPDPFYDLQHLNVAFWNDASNASSPNWGSNVTTVGSRNLAKGRGLLDDPLYSGEFRKARIDEHQRQPNFGIYSSSIENPHGLGHYVSGGSRGHMGNGMSPLDPIFWLHHCNVDRLWAEWQKAGNVTPSLGVTYANNFVDGKGNPVTTATAANAADIAPFGYTYDVLSVAALESVTSRLALESFESQTVLQPAAVNTAPRTFGETTAAKTAQMRTETRLPVAAGGLLPNLFQSRTYWATESLGVRRLAAESGRVLARLSITPPEKPTPMVVNVFANCPYLSPETGSNDKHYAGSFSFFGLHAGHGSTIYVDMTDALRGLAADGRIATENVNVQLMPLPIDPEAKASFAVASVQLLAT